MRRRTLIAGLAVLHAGLVALSGTEARGVRGHHPEGHRARQPRSGSPTPATAAIASSSSSRRGASASTCRARSSGAPCGQAGTRFLDIRSRIASGGERGLLGLAFHPQYATNGFFFVYYTSVANATPPVRNTGDIVIARYTVTADPNIADPASERILIVIPHSSASATTTAGRSPSGPTASCTRRWATAAAAATPSRTARTLSTMLGKIHRIDVNEPNPPFYRIPPTNPFQSGGPGTCGQFPGSLRRDLGLRAAQPLAVQLRPSDRRPLHRGRRPGRVGGDRLPARGRRGRPQLRLGRAGGRPARCRAGPDRQLLRERPRRLLRGLHQRRLHAPRPRVRPQHRDHGHRRLRLPRAGDERGVDGRPTCSPTSAAAGIWRGFRDGGGNWQMQEMFTGQPVHHQLRRGRSGRTCTSCAAAALFQIYPWSVDRRAPGLVRPRASSSGCTRRA